MNAQEPYGPPPTVGDRPLRIAVLAKQVPVPEDLWLGEDGRLRRDGTDLEMNPYCRRAVSQGSLMARATGGSCTIFTLGPPAAEDVLREAVAWGADDGVHICDDAFAGSDTLATAKALAAALHLEGPFDLVLVGRNSIDGDTGQVGPQVAQLAGLAFAGGARQMELAGGTLRLGLELDDGWDEVEVALPAVVSVAERLCEPCKVAPEGRRAVPAGRIRRLTAGDLGPGPWGIEGSPTRVGALRAMAHDRARIVLSGEVASQVATAVALLHERGALTPGWGRPETDVAEVLAEEAVRSWSSALSIPVGGPGPPVVAVVVEPDHPQAAAELLGAAARLASEIGGTTVALLPSGPGEEELVAAPAAPRRPTEHWGSAGWLGALGADEVVELRGEGVAEDVAATLVDWAIETQPWAVLVPSTTFGREVAGRASVGIDAGLVGDAIALDVVDGRLVAAKPALSGTLIADISCASQVQMVTVRPGVLAVPPSRDAVATLSRRNLPSRGRVRIRSHRKDDDVEVLARAEVVIGLGTGVRPEEYATLGPLAAVLGAELAATRKVTDLGWAPRSRQVGITGRSIAPRLYICIGLSGKFNHMIGVRAAGTVLAVNADPEAPVFAHADVGVVADWRAVLPVLVAAVRDTLGAHHPIP